MYKSQYLVARQADRQRFHFTSTADMSAWAVACVGGVASSTLSCSRCAASGGAASTMRLMKASWLSPGLIFICPAVAAPGQAVRPYPLTTVRCRHLDRQPERPGPLVELPDRQPPGNRAELIHYNRC